ncbi:hypothetical protein GALMADRAFT_257923 [Galerina marginata CBS 339.88]|uniref:Flavin reductase like domain-containing protein n=1 Tax=Galerina marginata (strain CBS 339.88) TaxID=685588 RepID=A0A067SIW3_GALM3|nr:hypothetical protein GALMADRAFT_257923 [Galerina marginata CBS 339.88]
MSHIRRCRRLALSSRSKVTPWTPTSIQVATRWRAVGTVSASASRPQLRREAKEELGDRDRTSKPTPEVRYHTREREADDTASRIHRKEESKRLKAELRSLLRNIAQPVAVVTSFMPNSRTPTSPANSIDHKKANIYHGATLSSFTSIAMDPYPLVAFALRIPSRMATTLASLSNSSSPSSLPSAQGAAHMVVNLLSASQASTAVTFSRPDLHPTPFHDSSSLEKNGVPYILSQDGLPIINGVVGALSCRLVGGPIPLYDLEFLEQDGKSEPAHGMPVLGKGEAGSELFIARVLRVETVTDGEEVKEGDERTLPLVYHQRNYTTCRKES